MDNWSSYTSCATQDLRRQTIVEHLPLVKYVLGRLALRLPNGADYEDVLQAGVLALIGCVDNYDPARGVKFPTYAIPYIRGRMLDHLRATSGGNRSGRRWAKVLEDTMTKLIQERGAVPSHQELADYMGLTLEQYETALDHSKVVHIPLQDLVAADHREDYTSVLQDPGPSLEEIVEEDELVDRLAEGISKLPDREQLILSLLYREGLTGKEAAEVLGVSPSRVSQLHTKAILGLRAYFRSADSEVGLELVAHGR